MTLLKIVLKEITVGQHLKIQFPCWFLPLLFKSTNSLAVKETVEKEVPQIDGMQTRDLNPEPLI